jgi:hypothetical protein
MRIGKSCHVIGFQFNSEIAHWATEVATDAKVCGVTEPVLLRRQDSAEFHRIFTPCRVVSSACVVLLCRILPSLLKEAVFQDYIGSIKNTESACARPISVSV